MRQHEAEEATRLEQLRLLDTPLGEPGSGYTRYAAAMWLHLNGYMTHNRLEAYRICCKRDDEDPTKFAADTPSHP
ncbi:MAG: hypothetical protein AAF217_07145 [Pseudomonadota bacterium]